jgi:hypothetical protein
VGLVAIGFMLPAKWRVQRAIMINAPANQIYPLIANLKEGWPQWSAFDLEDPTIQYSYSGPNEGEGAERSWISTKMGDGYQKITKATRVSGIEFELGMPKNDILIHGKISFDILPDTTVVTWTDSGDMGANPFKRYMGALMDKMMGSTFEKSLAALKQKAEDSMKKPAVIVPASQGESQTPEAK